MNILLLHELDKMIGSLLSECVAILCITVSLIKARATNHQGILIPSKLEQRYGLATSNNTKASLSNL